MRFRRAAPGARRAPIRRAEQPRPLASPAREGAEGIGSGREAGAASLPDAPRRRDSSEQARRRVAMAFWRLDSC